MRHLSNQNSQEVSKDLDLRDLQKCLLNLHRGTALLIKDWDQRNPYLQVFPLPLLYSRTPTAMWLSPTAAPAAQPKTPVQLPGALTAATSSVSTASCRIS